MNVRYHGLPDIIGLQVLQDGIPQLDSSASLRAGITAVHVHIYTSKYFVLVVFSSIEALVLSPVS